MKILKKYKPEHYKYYSDKVNGIISQTCDISKWVKKQSKTKLEIWIKKIDIINVDSDEYFEDIAIVISLIIRLFILELGLKEDKIELKNSEIEKLINRFEYIIKLEYAFKNKLIKRRKKYTLLKDTVKKKDK